MTVILSEYSLEAGEARCRGHWSDQAWLAKLCEGCLRYTASDRKGWYVEPAINVDKAGRVWCAVRLDRSRCEP